jgi:hypothetical protein
MFVNFMLFLYDDIELVRKPVSFLTSLAISRRRNPLDCSWAAKHAFFSKICSETEVSEQL